MRDTLSRMKAKISKGGQISIPAAVRHRWGTPDLLIEDQGDRLVVRPMPEDPIEAASGAFPGKEGDALRMKEQLRREEEAIERRKWGR